MKKRTWVIVSVAVLLIGVMTVVGITFRRAKLANTETIELKDVEQLKINYQSDSIYLYKSKTEQLIVKEYLANSKQAYLAKVDQGKKDVTITGGKRDLSTGLLVQDSKIEIYLPKSYHGDLEVAVASGSFKTDDYFSLAKFEGKAHSGTFSLKDLKAKELLVETTSGSIKANKLTAKNLELICRSGSIKVADSRADTIQATTTSGSLVISKLKGDAKVKATSGSIKIAEIDGAAAIKTTSGSINGTFIRVNGDITAEATSGSIKLKVPESTAFNFKGEVTSGGLHTDFDELLETQESVSKAEVGQNPVHDLTGKVTSGSLTIRYL